MSLRDGARVSYVGEDEHLAVGDRGQVLKVAGSSSHVMWRTGARAGAITLEPNMDLVIEGKAKSSVTDWDDSLDSPMASTISVRATFDRHGASGLLDALSDEGHLSVLEVVAEDAVAFVASRLRQDIMLRDVLADLDPDDGEEVVQHAAKLIFREARQLLGG